jgi:glucokinase
MNAAETCPMPPLILGIDVGGTKIAGGLITVQGKMTARRELPTQQEQGFDHSSGQMFRVIEALLEQAHAKNAPIAGIGVCAPGPLDPHRRVLVNPPNLTGWNDLFLGNLLEERYGCNVSLGNDANAAGLAEVLWGAAAGFDHVFYVTVSTGIGTGIILNRRILLGKNGMAGEGGHVTINYREDAPRCNCGNMGCIEAYASGTAMARRARRKLEEMPRKPPLLVRETGGDWESLTAKQIGTAAEQGDAFSREIIRETGILLGIWLGSIVSVLDTEVIVIGGGVARIGDALFEPIRETLPGRTINLYAAKTPVVRARLDRDVGIFGAAALVMADPLPGSEKETVR